MSSEDNGDVLPPGYELPGYRITKLIGRGSFGVTYLGEAVPLGTPVAIKEYMPLDIAERGPKNKVRPKVGTKTELFQAGLDSFLNEARVLSNLPTHPNIVGILQYFIENGTGYLVMEHISGPELLELILEANGKMDPMKVEQILLGLIDGLEVIHKAGFLHRDIKPTNIRHRETGEPVFIDFGASRQNKESRSRPLTAILTPGYAPIEQYSENGDQRDYTDIYALAATTYSALNGGPPPDASLRLRNDPYDPLEPRAKNDQEKRLFAAIDWGVRPDEVDRPQSASEWRRALKGEMAPAQPRPVESSTEKGRHAGESPEVLGYNTGVVQPRSQKNTGGNRGLLIAAGVLLLAAGSGIGLIALDQTSGGPGTSEQRPSQSRDLKSVQVQARPDGWAPISNKAIGRDISEFALVSDGPFRLRVEGRTYLIEPGSGLPPHLDLTDPDQIPEVKAVGGNPITITMLYE